MASVMPVSSTTFSGMGRRGLISWLKLATSRPPSKRTAPNSMMVSFWGLRPVVSTSSTTQWVWAMGLASARSTIMARSSMR